MGHNVDLWRRDLYHGNLRMLLLCALCSVSLLISPLIPYTFDLGTAEGISLFTLAFLSIAIPLGWMGVSLNHMAAYHRRITVQDVRAVLVRARRR